jgi:hypothetical protein
LLSKRLRLLLLWLLLTEHGRGLLLWLLLAEHSRRLLLWLLLTKHSRGLLLWLLLRLLLTERSRELLLWLLLTKPNWGLLLAKRGQRLGPVIVSRGRNWYFRECLFHVPGRRDWGSCRPGSRRNRPHIHTWLWT